MRTQLREIEIAAEGQMQSASRRRRSTASTFDPLEFDRFSRMQELTRFLAESLGDVITLHQGLQKNLDETELAIHAQARLNRELQQGLMGVRLVPLAQPLRPLLPHRAPDRQGARQEGQPRAQGRARRARPLACSRRSPRPSSTCCATPSPTASRRRAERARGRQARDRRDSLIERAARQRGGAHRRRRRRRPQLRAHPREGGRSAACSRADVELPDAQLAQFIFDPGFSTADEVSQLAGRGVGMDVVRNEITSLGGRVEIASDAGRGTHLHDHLPLTLAVTQAVMLRAGAAIFAVPSVMVEQVQEIQGRSPTPRSPRKGEIAWKDNRYPLRSLLPLLGEIDTPTPARQIPVLLLQSGVQRAAMRVDEIIGNREVVVKNDRPAALAPGGHRRRHGARQRPGRADPEPGAAGAPRRRARPRRREPRPRRGPASARSWSSTLGRAARHGGGRLAHGAQDHQPHAHARGLRGATGQGRRRRAAAAAGHQARLHPARRRDAAHGRLRIRAQRARRRARRRRSRSS